MYAVTPLLPFKVNGLLRAAGDTLAAGNALPVTDNANIHLALGHAFATMNALVLVFYHASHLGSCLLGSCTNKLS